MGRVNMKAKAAKAVSKLKQVQQLPVFMKVKNKLEKQHLLSTPTKTNSIQKNNCVKASPAKSLESQTKKDKLRRKHKNLMNKFALVKEQALEELQRKKRAKTSIVGDLLPLKDALPSLDELELYKKANLLKTGTSEIVKSPKLNKRQKIKEKKAIMLQKVKSYKALLENRDFKQNSRETISNHIKYTHGLIDE